MSTLTLIDTEYILAAERTQSQMEELVRKSASPADCESFYAGVFQLLNDAGGAQDSNVLRALHVMIVEHTPKKETDWAAEFVLHALIGVEKNERRTQKKEVSGPDHWGHN
tara:strand:- start:3844 stop:4173 length:330 start_codon:yes stop_codon:yes gene_type:complete